MSSSFVRRVVSVGGMVILAFIISTFWRQSNGTAWAASFSYDGYGNLLKSYVDAHGMVDYRGLKANRRPLDHFTSSMSRLDPRVYDGWNEKEKVAFWINAYNALTLKAIIDHYPIEASLLKSFVYPKNSIRQISGVWDKLPFSVMGRDITLDGIEHKVLRATFNEPRIHVALVCAAMGCPPLRNEPYADDKLESQLDDQATRFMKNAEKFRIDRNGNKVYLSPIFDWFGQDFVKNYGTGKGFPGFSEKEKAVLNFMTHYVEPADREYLLRGDFSLEYLKYDWSLNEKRLPGLSRTGTSSRRLSGE